MNVRAFSSAFLRLAGPTGAMTCLYLGPKMTKIAKNIARTASDILGGQRFLSVALPDNLSISAVWLIPPFMPKIRSAVTCKAQVATAMRFFTYVLLQCWLIDQVRRCLSCLSSKYLHHLGPSDAARLASQKSLPPHIEPKQRKLVPCPVGLSDEIEQTIEMVCREFKSPQLRSHYQITPLCGILLYGPSGTGKTSLAHHLASRLGCSTNHFRYISAPALLDKYVGQSEANIRKTFDQICTDAARRTSQDEPIIIAIDEIDSILSSRNRCKDFQLGMGTGLVNQFLTCMDQIKSLENVLLIGITNYKEYLDSAALRAGRFDTHLHLGIPTVPKSHEILDQYLSPLYAKGILSKNFDEVQIKSAIKGMTGAEIEAFVESAKRSALNRCSIFSEDCSKYANVELSDFKMLSHEIPTAIKTPQIGFFAEESNRNKESIGPNDCKTPTGKIPTAEKTSLTGALDALPNRNKNEIELIFDKRNPSRLMRIEINGGPHLFASEFAKYTFWSADKNFIYPFYHFGGLWDLDDGQVIGFFYHTKDLIDLAVIEIVKRCSSSETPKSLFFQTRKKETNWSPPR